MNLTAKRLKYLRDEKKLSQDELSIILGIDRTTYLKYEKSGKVPTYKIIKLANFYNVSSDYLLGLTDKPNNLLPNIKEYYISDDEKELLEIYRKLPPESKTTIRTLTKTQYDLYVKPKPNEKAI